MLLDRIELTIAKRQLPLSVIVVDDGCVDATRQIAEDKANEHGNISVVGHDKNKGFAAALRTGIETALAGGYDAAIFMDCDQTHDPTELPAFIRELNKGIDLVIGSRYVKKGGMVDVPLHRIMLSRIGNGFGRLFFRLPVRDASSGYRGLSRKAMESIKTEANDFSIQVEEIIRARKSGLSFSEIPIVLANRKLGASKFNLSIYAMWRYFALMIRSLTWR